MHDPKTTDIAQQRKDFAEYRRKSVEEEGFKGDFKAACIKEHKGIVPKTPAMWIVAAEAVYWGLYIDNHKDEWDAELAEMEMAYEPDTDDPGVRGPSARSLDSYQERQERDWYSGGFLG